MDRSYPCWGVIFIQFPSWFMNYFQKPTINSHLAYRQKQRKPVKKLILAKVTFMSLRKKNQIYDY